MESRNRFWTERITAHTFHGKKDYGQTGQTMAHQTRYKLIITHYPKWPIVCRDQ